jgi:hypothetical protein
VSFDVGLDVEIIDKQKIKHSLLTADSRMYGDC